MTDPVNQKNKRVVRAYWDALARAKSAGSMDVCRQYMAEQHCWRGFDPLGHLDGPEGFVKGFWAPLLESFPDLERKTWLYFGGRSNGRNDGANDGKMWVTGTGVLSATFSKDYLSIPATGRQVNVRWGEFCRLEDGKLAETFFLIDVIDLMQQAGFEVLPPGRGRAGIYPPPAANDGILLDPQDEAVSAYSLDHIRRFIFDGLNRFDESDLKSMGMAEFFHPDVSWYGPGGIGACLSFKEFETLHQKPWLHAFPDRAVQDLDALFAEGPFSGGPGWSGVLATHKGGYLGHAATGRRLGINGLDWWKREGEMYVENWVFVDMIHLFRQLDVDLFARLEELKLSVEATL
ncbi:MAG: ester cyclase [Gammaproteobacteria bacterium]|nr:ester cyclase [Gammaproteobacteria bacterium]